jgi:hypothetical protein
MCFGGHIAKSNGPYGLQTICNMHPQVHPVCMTGSTARPCYPFTCASSLYERVLLFLCGLLTNGIQYVIFLMASVNMSVARAIARHRFLNIARLLWHILCDTCKLGLLLALGGVPVPQRVLYCHVLYCFDFPDVKNSLFVCLYLDRKWHYRECNLGLSCESQGC